MGNITTQTLKAFTEAEYRKIVANKAVHPGGSTAF
jgi:uncharacterized protein with GYD domain